MQYQIASYLPPFEGWLPKWLLLVSIISIANSIQAYTTLHYTARLYNPNSDTSRPPSTQYSKPPTQARSITPENEPATPAPAPAPAPTPAPRRSAPNGSAKRVAPNANGSASRSSSRSSTPPPEIPSQVTPLSARKFGTWTFLTSIVRLYAAYNINNPAIFQLALWTYAVAWVHFMSEWWIFKTTRWGTPLAGPVFVSTGSLIWMFLQKDYYLAQ